MFSLPEALDKPINGMTSMEIDWVRVYKYKIAVAGAAGDSFHYLKGHNFSKGRKDQLAVSLSLRPLRRP